MHLNQGIQAVHCAYEVLSTPHSEGFLSPNCEMFYKWSNVNAIRGYLALLFPKFHWNVSYRFWDIVQIYRQTLWRDQKHLIV